MSSANSLIVRERRIQIGISELEKIREDLEKKGYSFNYLRRIIGMSFEHLYRGRTNSINQESLKIIEQLIERKVKHRVILGKFLEIKIDNNEKLAEFIGIILGDGGLYTLPKPILSISLNSIDEKRYINYVKKLIHNLFQKNPSVKIQKNEKSVILRLYGKVVVGFLISKGLVSGDKVKNQVFVPYWIKRNKNLMIRCLKGLFDTDGSISLFSRNRTIILSFINGSLPLVEDFKEMCQVLGINQQKNICRIKNLTETGTKIAYQYTIQSKSYVRKFLTLINSEKWKDPHRREYIGIRLILLNCSQMIKSKVDEQILRDFPEKCNRRFTIEFTEYLKKLCSEFKINTNRKNIENAINHSLKYKYSED